MVLEASSEQDRNLLEASSALTEELSSALANMTPAIIKKYGLSVEEHGVIIGEMIGAAAVKSGISFIVEMHSIGRSDDAYRRRHDPLLKEVSDAVRTAISKWEKENAGNQSRRNS